ncbi:MAG: ATP synthase F1 subunit delta [bacterium]
MLTQIESVAKKYALAYLNLYIDELTNDMVEDLSRLKTFLHKNKKLYAYLSIPKLSLETKLNFIDRLCNAFNLSDSEITLMHLLVKQKRIDLLDPTLKKIIAEYHIKKGEVLTNVYTSHEINDKQKIVISNFVQNHVKEKVELQFFIDKSLINGIRIKSSRRLWEHSVRKHIKKFKNNLFQQAIL